MATCRGYPTPPVHSDVSQVSFIQHEVICANAALLAILRPAHSSCTRMLCSVRHPEKYSRVTEQVSFQRRRFCLSPFGR
jgi:hypothetical protein